MTVLIFAVLAILAEIIGTVGGFGSSLFFVPVAQFFFDTKTVLGVTGVFHVFSNLTKIVLFRKSINWKIALLFGVPSVIFVILGAWLTNVITFRFDQLLLGIFLIVFSLLLLIKSDFKLQPNPVSAISTGSIAGFMAGFLGTGGAVRGLGLAAYNLEKSLFVGTSAAIDMGVDLSRTVIYIGNGYFDRSLWYLVPVLIAVSIIGSYIGKKILEKIEQEKFRQLVLGLILIVGVAMTTKSIYNLITHI
jgi:uncharacterized membrane protein YfcA